MLRNRAAADELADVRSEIQTLKTREQALLDLMLNDPDSRLGETHKVLIRHQKTKVFCRDRLPGYVARDPAFWETRVTQRVTVCERSSISP